MGVVILQPFAQRTMKGRQSRLGNYKLAMVREENNLCAQISLLCRVSFTKLTTGSNMQWPQASCLPIKDLDFSPGEITTSLFSGSYIGREESKRVMNDLTKNDFNTQIAYCKP